MPSHISVIDRAGVNRVVGCGAREGGEGENVFVSEKQDSLINIDYIEI